MIMLAGELEPNDEDEEGVATPVSFETDYRISLQEDSGVDVGCSRGPFCHHDTGGRNELGRKVTQLGSGRESCGPGKPGPIST